MNDLRTAAQQALEAWGDLPWYQQPTALYPQMNALRAALAQEQAEPVRCPASHVCDCQEAGQPCARAAPKPVQEQAEPFTPDAIHATQAAWKMGYEARRAEEAEPVQEPVAWEGWWLHHGQHNYRAKPLTSERVKELMKLAFEVGREAAPPQRPPLTDEEIMDAFHAARNAKLGASQDNSKHRLSVVEIARAVERAHGIGEGA